MSTDALVLWSRQAEAMAGGVAGALIAAVWQGTLLVLAVALVLRALPGLSAAVRGRLWLGTLLGLVLLPAAEMLVPAQAAGRAGAGTGVRMAEGWSVALVAAWAVLALARALQLAASAVRLRRVAREGRPVEASLEVQALLGGVELCVSDEAARPSVAGWRRPRVLLPPAMWDEMTEAELRQVVLHEMEHLRRGDQWTNLLQKAALVAMPLSPAAMWVERRLCLERELACDDGVLRRNAGRKAYAACLTRLAEQAAAGSRVGREAVLALGAWGRQSELGVRVTRLLHGPERAMSAGRRRVAVVAVAGLVVLGGAGLTEVPRLVRFGPAPGSVVAKAQGTGEVPAAPTSTATVANSASALYGSAGEGGRMVLASAHVPERALVSGVPRVTGDGPAESRATEVRRGIALLKAPVGRPAQEPGVGAHLTRFVAKPTAPREQRRVSAALPRPARGRWVVLTSFEGDVSVRTVPTAQVLAVAVGDELLPSYAAVPVADGWLVVQL